MRAQNRQGAQNRDGLRAGIRIGRHVENGGLVEYFFGKDGTTCLHHDKFVQFLRDLHDEVYFIDCNNPPQAYEQFKNNIQIFIGSDYNLLFST